MSKKEKVLINADEIMPRLAQDLENEFDVTYLGRQPDPTAFLKEHGASFTGLVTHAGAGADAALVAALPKLKVVSSLGVGFDQLDENALKPRGIRVGYTPDVLNDCVADLALAMMLDISRGLTASDRFVRQGKWLSGNFPLQRRLSGKRLGILGMGRIGLDIARRAQAFDMSIAYHNRNRRDDVDFAYHDTPAALAAAVDYLVVVVTGGPATARLVNAEVLAALGPEGYLINISRGSVVDDEALINALRSGGIAGAALDVFTDEPNVPEALLTMDNVLLAPHIGSATHETRAAMAQLVVDNLRAYYTDGEVLKPVPWSVR